MYTFQQVYMQHCESVHVLFSVDGSGALNTSEHLKWKSKRVSRKLSLFCNLST